MSPNLQTSHIRFAVQQYAFPNRSHGIHVEIPVTRFKSLEDIANWLKIFGHPVVVHALVSIEIPTTQKLEMMSLDPYLDFLALSSQHALTALAETLADQSMDPHGSDEIEELEFVVIRIDELFGSIPGLYVEIAHGTDIERETEWWGNQLLGSVIAHVSIEVYRDTLPLNVRSALAAKDHGEPEALEKLVAEHIIRIINLFAKA